MCLDLQDICLPFVDLDVKPLQPNYIFFRIDDIEVKDELWFVFSMGSARLNICLDASLHIKLLKC